MKVLLRLWARLGLAAFLIAHIAGAESDTSIDLTFTNNTKVLNLPLISGVDEFKILRSTNITQSFTESSSGVISGYQWMETGTAANEFFTVEMRPKSSNEVLEATLLNRLAYGPTPDEIERVASIGPEAFIQEQLAPENITEDLLVDQEVPSGEWQYVTCPGYATSSTLYIYSTGVGDCYFDNIKLVPGATAGVGANLLANGDFESGLIGWNVSTNLTNSVISTEVRHDGVNALHLVSSAPGTTKASAIWRDGLKLTPAQFYTLSYWYKPGTNMSGNVILRLSSSDDSGSGLYNVAGALPNRLANGQGTLSDLMAWHSLHAVQSKKQLLEVLLQFLENHFVTQETKSRDYFDRYYDSGENDWQAANLEYREINRWRKALLSPQCTFYDLLKISAESSAMILYLDTVDSRGDGKKIANENYARELLELFTFGVDNGYDQADITTMSRAWTGWTIRLVEKTNEFNPFATNSFTLRIGGTNQPGNKPPTPANAVGLWSFYYDATHHNISNKIIFPGKTLPARFGTPYAGQNYELNLPARSGTNGIKDGYEVVAHLANQPFTQEYISVKLCRLLVHDDFVHGVYDYSSPDLSPEGRLVRDCMRAWEENEPKGQIRKVLDVIFHSDLFRAQGASMQKVKTPFEFTVSALRALRSLGSDNSYTAETDGYSLRTPMTRMGRMRLFDRDTPDGYPEAAAPWISAGTLMERLRFVQTVLMKPAEMGKADSGVNMSDPVKLLKAKLPQKAWKDPNVTASYFLNILFPAEGKANLDLYHSRAVTYLNTADDGIASSAFSNLIDTSTTYDTRVRGMVAMLMTFQRFQEQ